jgi:hypothetical protein
MILARVLLGAGVLSMVALGAACSSSAQVASTDAGIEGGAGPDAGLDGPAPSYPGQWPAKPDAPASTAAGLRTFAVRALYLGDTNRAGVRSATAWKALGYNLDGKVTDSSSSDVCQRVPGAIPAAQADGDLGADNAFGLSVMPIISGVDPDATLTQSKRLAEGGTTTLFQVTGLSADPAQTNTGLVVEAFAAAPFDSIDGNAGKRPTFAGDDNWPVLPSATKSGTVASGAAVRSTDAYVVGGVLVARFDQINIQVLLVNSTLVLPIRGAVVTGRVVNGTLAEGAIAGVVAATDMRKAIATELSFFTDQFCVPEDKEKLLSLIDQSADILGDGTNDSSVGCDGVSVGLGFEAAAIAEVKSVGTLPPPAKDLCAL